MSSPVLGDKDHQGQSRILNLPAPIADTEPIRKVDVAVTMGGVYVGMTNYCLNPDNIPTDWLVMDGSSIPVASYTALVTAIYCGDANNATAQWGYRCNNSGGTGRNTTGAYLVLPDDRDRYTRGWREGGDFDLWTYYEDEIGAHDHGSVQQGAYPNRQGGSSNSFLSRGPGASMGSYTDNLSQYRSTTEGGPENRPRTSLKIPIIYAGPA